MEVEDSHSLCPSITLFLTHYPSAESSRLFHMLSMRNNKLTPFPSP